MQAEGWESGPAHGTGSGATQGDCFLLKETFRVRAAPGGRGAAAGQLSGVCAGAKWPAIGEEAKPPPLPPPNQGDLESYDQGTQQPHDSTFTLQQFRRSLCAAAKI